MNRPLPLFVFALLSPPASAQNWIVGVPVAELLSDGICTSTSCYPNPDWSFNFPVSNVLGVQHVAIVDQVTPLNLVTVIPGPVDPLEVGDTIFIDAPGARQVYFPTGVGLLDLRFMAVGTPTMAGQAHPCVYNNLWLSFGLCPESWSLSLSNTCIVQPGSVGLNESTTRSAQVQFPTAANGWSLRITDPTVRSVEVFNAAGIRMATFNSGSITCDWQEGVYFARINGAAGTRTERLVIASR